MGEGGDMTWDEMVKIEPTLQSLYERAKKTDGSGKHFCANGIFYDEYKPLITSLVGFDARDEQLGTVECYDRAYQKIWSALPPCKDCLCM